MLPQWLHIQPEDDEKTRIKKKKLVKSYKSKIRFQKLDSQQREKQSSWLDFQKGKGTKKKAGFFTGAFRTSSYRACLLFPCCQSPAAVPVCIAALLVTSGSLTR